MVRGPDETESEYFLIPRDEEGDYITTAEEIVRERGIPDYTQIVVRSTSSFAHEELVILQELQDLLPDTVHLETKNPFLTLRVTPHTGPFAPEVGAKAQRSEGEDPEPMSRCMCRCGDSGSCSGSGHGK
jgi:hypothetical protein